CSTVAALRCSAAVIAMASLESWLSWGQVALHDAADTQARAGANDQWTALVVAMSGSPFPPGRCCMIDAPAALGIRRAQRTATRRYRRASRPIRRNRGSTE